MGVVFLIVIIVIAVWVLASCVRIVPQAYAVILERLGAYQATWSTGIHFKVPFIERVARKVNLKEQGSPTLIHSKVDVKIIGYGYNNKSILMK